mgnify:FL=1|tara:strand:+ start:144 stop:548 length:405 start_codon:yes stop_codon:yes gene_type:complete
MIGKLNHVAIAVPDITESSKTYEVMFKAEVSEIIEQPEHGVKIVFITLPNTKIELISPLDKNSPISNFLQRNPNGGIHHLCYEVESIDFAIQKLSGKGFRILGSGKPKLGGHGKPVIFLHPSDFNGTLIELQQE